MAILLSSAMLLEALAIHWLIAMSLRRGWVDQPGGRKTHSRATPYLGGVGIFISLAWSFCLAMVLLPELTVGRERLLLATGYGSFAFTLFGLFDDLKEIPAKGKLPIQILVALGLMFFLPELRLGILKWMPETWPGSITETLSWLAPMAWIVVLSNAINIIDGMDGLGPLVGLSASIALSIMSHTIESLSSSVFLLLSGLLFTFLYFNWPPARIFLGNSGSMLLGFLLSFCSLFLLAEHGWGVTTPGMVFVFSYPILDMTVSVARRIHSRRSIFQADSGHIHHQLNQLTGNPRRTLLILALYVALSEGTAITFQFAGHAAQGIALGVFLLATIGLVRASSRREILK